MGGFAVMAVVTDCTTECSGGDRVGGNFTNELFDGDSDGVGERLA